MTAVGRLIEEWQEVRRQLATHAAAEHPDITDRYGRIWAWAGRGDLYAHDATLAYPRRLVEHPDLGLPAAHLGENPNYARLCAACRAHWPVVQLELFTVRWARVRGEVRGVPLDA